MVERSTKTFLKQTILRIHSKKLREILSFSFNLWIKNTYNTHIFYLTSKSALITKYFKWSASTVRAIQITKFLLKDTYQKVNNNNNKYNYLNKKKLPSLKLI